MDFRIIRCFLYVFFSFTIISCVDQVNLENHKPEPVSGIHIFEEGNISTHLYERDMAISNSGDEFVYSVADIKQRRRCLVSLRKLNGKWGQKRILPFSGSYQDIEPFFDDSNLFFASNRPINASDSSSDYNIFISVQLENGKYSEPKILNTSLNTGGDEFYPSVSDNGNLYFTATRADGIGREDIFKVVANDTGYGSPIVLDTAINTRAYEFNAFISPEEDLIVFSSFGRKDGFGGGDLYYSQKDGNGNWRKAENMGDKINSSALDYCPFIDYNEGYFYFTSERADSLKKHIRNVEEIDQYFHQTLNGLGNIYRIKLSEMPWE